MFFYALLFIGSVIAAVMILYLYNMLLRIGKSVYRSRLPGSRDNLTSHLDAIRFSTAINDVQTPWGWKSHATPESTARTHPAAPNRQAPWGWSGNNSNREVRDRGPGTMNPDATGFDAFLSNNVGASGPGSAQQSPVRWPFREDKSEAAGRVYKVTRKAGLPKTNLKNTAKPWGW